MSRLPLVVALLLALFCPSRGHTIETAPPISDREVIERLTRLEEGVKALREGQDSLRQGQDSLRQGQELLRQGMNAQMQQLRTDMNMQIQQLRTDMNAQFSYVFQLMLGMLGAFAAIVTATISFALWDRRTMIRPFESKVKAIEEEMAQDRKRFHALLEALRSLSVHDRRLADLLKQFDLL